MEMDKLVGVVVIMNYLMLLDMVQLHAEQLVVHGVIMFGKIMPILHQLQLQMQLNQQLNHHNLTKRLDLIETNQLEH